jgi:hypothetical protein
VLGCISPGAGIAGLLISRLVESDDLRRSSREAYDPGERWSPALMAAAACNEESDGDCGGGGLGTAAKTVVKDMSLVPCVVILVSRVGVLAVVIELMSGDMVA